MTRTQVEELLNLYPTTAQIDIAMENLATTAQVENMLQSLTKPAVNFVIETRDGATFAVMMTADGKTYEFPVAEV